MVAAAIIPVQTNENVLNSAWLTKHMDEKVGFTITLIAIVIHFYIIAKNNKLRYSALELR